MVRENESRTWQARAALGAEDGGLTIYLPAALTSLGGPACAGCQEYDNGHDTDADESVDIEAQRSGQYGFEHGYLARRVALVAQRK